MILLLHVGAHRVTNIDEHSHMAEENLHIFLRRRNFSSTKRQHQAMSWNMLLNFEFWA